MDLSLSNWLEIQWHMLVSERRGGEGRGIEREQSSSSDTVYYLIVLLRHGGQLTHTSLVTYDPAARTMGGKVRGEEGRERDVHIPVDGG